MALDINLDETTFPKLLKANAEKFGDKKIALREKEFGIWQSFTWKQYYENVKYFSLGLISLGLEKDDKVAIIGDNRPEWVYSEIAAQAAGGISIGLYQDSTLNEVAYVIDFCDAKFVVAEDQEQVDKILEIKEKLPKVGKVIYTDPRGMRKYDEDYLIYFQDVIELGKELEKEQPDLFEENVEKTKGDDIAIICTTSGTTGFPKGALLSFKNLLSMALSLNQVDAKLESDEFVSFLPLAWIGEQMMSVSSALAIGFTINFPEEPETVNENIREIGPNVMFSPPRVWENITSTVQVKIMDTTPFKRFLFNLFMPVGYKIAELNFAKKPVPFFWKILYGISYICLFRALKDRLGFSKIRSASTGGAALGPDVFKFYHALGVNLKQIYGQTEISGISCIHKDGDVNGDSVGLPIPGTEIKISEKSEILSRSESVFKGYYNNAAATKETVIDGWLHSGDAGYINEDGHLIVIDRLKDVMELADGTQFSPQFIENKLKFSPYIKEAIVVGKARPYLTALICIDIGIVGKWAEKNKLSYTTYTDLSSKAKVYDFIEKEMDKVNKTLPKAAKIQKFILLYKELDADDEELTRTRKVRRGFCEERYKDVIETMYTEKDEVDIDTTIKFQDGKTTRIQTKVMVRNLKWRDE